MKIIDFILFCGLRGGNKKKLQRSEQAHFLFSKACEQVPSEDGKKILAGAEQKNSENKAIGAGTGEPVDFVFVEPIRP